MNAFLKGEVITEIRKHNNKIEKIETPLGEKLTVISSRGRLLIEVLNGKDSHVLKVGGEEVSVDAADFADIVSELHICYATEVGGGVFEDTKLKIPSDIFRDKKEK